eukprot:TRINITY_DN12613_c0_g1_i4.p1 TRINITY_DN12613_c0_g1~~TRINITY_DN12613_c0_g1_i4.p1  ORF type:complete len:514 (-),score=147.79 TRINITY_DN12613_c0_g1_i4:183-1724(-)
MCIRDRLYLTEIVLRVHVVKGFKAFFNDRRGATYRFQNGLMLCLAVCGTVAQTLSYILPSRYDPLCQGLAALQLWRILAVEIHFRQISHAFFLGLKPVQLFISLLLLVMFTYCVFATYFFHDVENDDGTMSFKTLEDTCLTMHQVFIGEGWHSVMQDSVDRTNKALIWFFASYVLVVGVLFSNLFVGILINMFQYGTEMYGELGGRVRLEMSQFTPDCTEEDFERLLLNLGHIGEIIHFPRRTLHAAIHERYQDRIEQTGGHLYSWASSLVVSGFRRVVHNATRNKLKFLEEQLPAGITSTAARMAVVEAAREFGADDTGHMVTDDTTLFAVVHSTCEKLALGVERTEWMGEELRRRRAAYLRLFEERRLSPDARAAYKGLPDPSKVAQDLTRLLITFYKLLRASEGDLGLFQAGNDTVHFVEGCEEQLRRSQQELVVPKATANWFRARKVVAPGVDTSVRRKEEQEALEVQLRTREAAATAAELSFAKAQREVKKVEAALLELRSRALDDQA